ncbi:hypothetical protein ACLK19_12720 [Escherichia coli]
MMDVIQEIQRQLLMVLLENVPNRSRVQNLKTRVCLMDLRSIPAKPCGSQSGSGGRFVG